jgi:hypothetical protein
MDPLTQLLIQRQLAAQGEQPVPSVLPNPDPKVPSEAKRFNNAQAIQNAYRNGWSPNPVLLQASQR